MHFVVVEVTMVMMMFIFVDGCGSEQPRLVERQHQRQASGLMFTVDDSSLFCRCIILVVTVRVVEMLRELQFVWV